MEKVGIVARVNTVILFLLHLIVEEEGEVVVVVEGTIEEA
jgi:hypothetical protein